MRACIPNNGGLKYWFNIFDSMWNKQTQRINGKGFYFMKSLFLTKI